ncbi:MAG: type II 3-dehydroquinate dehydratase [Bacteroidia bacterium]|nr:type II 3-dehydroquinate dehydratase [Bacteroidia bacterium]HRG03428.1 type II 3-dehydroquinate dehydratase [Paludibacteraceae bacterium]
MKKIIIINGPNLNLLGKREPDVYGNQDFENYFNRLKASYPDVELDYFQSNVEGEIINKLHETGFSFDGIILNAGAYTHTSIAIADAIRGITVPVVEVHISNVFSRENFRHHSYLSEVCRGVIVGFGLDSYRLAIESYQAASLFGGKLVKL